MGVMDRDYMRERRHDDEPRKNSHAKVQPVQSAFMQGFRSELPDFASMFWPFMTVCLFLLLGVSLFANRTYKQHIRQLQQQQQQPASQVCKLAQTA